MEVVCEGRIAFCILVSFIHDETQVHHDDHSHEGLKCLCKYDPGHPYSGPTPHAIAVLIKPRVFFAVSIAQAVDLLQGLVQVVGLQRGFEFLKAEVRQETRGSPELVL